MIRSYKVKKVDGVFRVTFSEADLKTMILPLRDEGMELGIKYFLTSLLLELEHTEEVY